jgi:hypothetical protein
MIMNYKLLSKEEESLSQKDNMPLIKNGIKKIIL